MSRFDGYKKLEPITINIDKTIDIFNSMDASEGLRDDAFYKNNDNLFSLTDIMVRKFDATSYEFYGLHKIKEKEKEKEKEKALIIANMRASSRYSILKHLEGDDKPIKTVFEENKQLIDKMNEYFWISYLYINTGNIHSLSAGISSIRDGQKLLGTAIDYLKTEGIIKTLGIIIPNPKATSFYTKMGFDMTKPPYTTPIGNLNSDVNIFLTSDSVVDGFKKRSKRRKSKRKSKKRSKKRSKRRKSRK